MLKTLFKAFQNKDVVVFLGGRSNPFANSGLSLCIHSCIPQEAKDNAVEADEDNIRMLAAAEATGIEARLKAVQDADTSGRWDKRCSYLALSPQWASESVKERTEYDVIFWLNPHDQKNNNSGWFTVEELDQWIAREGPVPKE